MTPPTLMQHSNEVFRESSSNRRNLKTLVSRFSLNGKHFENGAFQKQWRRDLPTRVFQTQIQKEPLIIAFLNFSDLDVKHLMRFQSENTVLKFLRHKMNESYEE